MRNNFFFPRIPLAKFVTYVLSNGASIRLPIAATSHQQVGLRFANLVSACMHGCSLSESMQKGRHAKPRCLQDIFNHIKWSHRIPTESSTASKDVLPDMSQYYSKYKSTSQQSEQQQRTKSKPGHRR